jgi:hypothetical protein
MDVLSGPVGRDVCVVADEPVGTGGAGRGAVPDGDAATGACVPVVVPAAGRAGTAGRAAGVAVPPAGVTPGRVTLAGGVVAETGAAGFTAAGAAVTGAALGAAAGFGAGFFAALVFAVFSASAASSAAAISRKCLRTRSACTRSIELECVFFSVTPASGRYSIRTFALISSSLASSLIRT